MLDFKALSGYAYMVNYLHNLLKKMHNKFILKFTFLYFSFCMIEIFIFL